LAAVARDERLTDEEVATRLTAMPNPRATSTGWSVAHGRLHCELVFPGFADAIGFMVAVSIDAERIDHHPDWSNSWNRVVISIVSHEAGGITARCFELAAAIDRHVP
jgi:4a-hydroxytetrahydrobiopterin dehydratase